MTVTKDSYIRLIVKGNKFEAAQAAADRKVPSVFVSSLPNETILHVDSQHCERVVKWFCETDEQKPYPTGTLLYYNSPSK